MKTIELTPVINNLAQELTNRGWRLGTAESCTGGWIAKACTDMDGSSNWFEGGIVSYSNEMKENLLLVPNEVLKKFGAVSEETVQAMALGLLHQLDVDLAIAVSGVAGPRGGTAEKPVGTVWISWCVKGCNPEVKKCLFDGDREKVRLQTVETALQGTLEILKKNTVLG